jgi:hypothetical protein
MVSLVMFRVFPVVGLLMVAACFADPRDASAAAPPPAYEVAILRDPAGTLTLDDLLDTSTAHRFEPVGEGIPSYGYTRDVIWLRCEVADLHEQPRTRVAELAIARLSRVDWHVIAGAPGHQAPVEFSPVKGRYSAIVYDAPPGMPHHVLVRVKSDTSIYLPFKLYDLPDYFPALMLRDFADFCFLGFGCAIGLIALFLGIYQRNRPYLVLALCVASFLAYYLIFSGYTVWLLSASSRWVLGNLMLMCGVLHSSGYLLFTARFLRDAAASPRLINTLYGGFYAGLGIMALLAVVPFEHSVKYTGLIFAALNITGAICAFGHTLRTRSSHDILLGITWVTILIPILLLLAVYQGLVPLFITPTNLQRILIPCIYILFMLAVAGQLRQSRAEKERLFKAEQAATVAQLQALRFQINPHFLFNTLTAIDALAHEAPARVSDLIEKLAAFLRLRLKPAPGSIITLKDELESVRAYLAIEKIRFEDRLVVEESVDPVTLSARVPELILQPLVENAIKHGRAREQIRRLDLSTTRQGDHLIIRIENEGAIKPDQPAALQGTGIGNRNLSERLALLYGEQAAFALGEHEGRVTATVKIPWETAL